MAHEQSRKPANGKRFSLTHYPDIICLMFTTKYTFLYMLKGYFFAVDKPTLTHRLTNSIHIILKMINSCLLHFFFFWQIWTNFHFAFLTRLSAVSPRPVRRVILTWCFFSSQLSTCFSLVIRSWGAMPAENVSSLICTGAVKTRGSNSWLSTHSRCNKD